MTEFIDVAVTPVEALLMPADCFVVVDVLRATTTIATLFGGGMDDLVVVNDVEEARTRARADNRLLFGEIGGLPPQGFDHGNSPVEAAALRPAGQRALLFTTNGTAALCALAGRGAVVAGAPANLTAVARSVAQYSTVVVVCAGSGSGTRFALDDFAAAGAFVEGIGALSPGIRLGDAAVVARQLVNSHLEGLGALLHQSHHGQLLTSLGLGSDVDFSAAPDSSVAVPFVAGWGQGWAQLENRPTGRS